MSIAHMQKMLELDSRFLQEFHALFAGHSHDPHRLLGLHCNHHGERVIRIWRPGAIECYARLFSQDVPMQQVHAAGLFELKVPEEVTYADYAVYHSSGICKADPYTFLPTFGEVDVYLFGKGTHYELYEKMGARCVTHQKCSGVKFSVWAPNAKSVSLVGDFNLWDGRVNPMRSLGHSGVWELFIPGLGEGVLYKFELKGHNNQVFLKADPYALQGQLRPETASCVADLDVYEWRDHAWMSKRLKEGHNLARPISIYEVHLGSWKQPAGKFLDYRTLAHQLAEYCQDMGFTHVELLPIAEHPLDESWGYQVTGFFAVTSRYGKPCDFQYFVDYLHQKNIGVILDWVPGHFPVDAHALALFDGTALYEHADPKEGFHPHWNTHIFNYSRHEVSNFIIANALFWFDKMHIDGLRVDAVASMLYRDYGRVEGEWVPNIYGGRENLEAIELLKHLNSVVPEKHPGVLMIAEESTSFTGVSQPITSGGLGFNLKWNMGWMNDTLSYFVKDPVYRMYHHDQLTFGLIYAFSEHFVLVMSHDEVVHGKRSLLDKMPGDMWQKFANLRLLYSYMLCQPGKLLLFMGGEFGQWTEWNCKKEIDWALLRFPTHDGLRTMVKELNHIYLKSPALWERDFDWQGFEWVDFADRHNSVIVYKRKADKQEFLCVHNFTPTYHYEYVAYVGNVRELREIFNSDAQKYGGSGKEKQPVVLLRGDDEKVYGVKMSVAPLVTQIFEISYE